MEESERRQKLAELAVLEQFDILRQATGHDFGAGQRAAELARRRRELRHPGSIDVTDTLGATAEEMAEAFERVGRPRLARIEREDFRRHTAATGRTFAAWTRLERRLAIAAAKPGRKLETAREFGDRRQAPVRVEGLTADEHREAAEDARRVTGLLGRAPTPPMTPLEKDAGELAELERLYKRNREEHAAGWLQDDQLRHNLREVFARACDVRKRLAFDTAAPQELRDRACNLAIELEVYRDELGYPADDPILVRESSPPRHKIRVEPAIALGGYAVFCSCGNLTGFAGTTEEADEIGATHLEGVDEYADRIRTDDDFAGKAAEAYRQGC